MMVPVLDSKDMFYLKGRGLVFCGEIDVEIPAGYRGEIIINGKGGGHKFEVLGLEIYSIARPDNMINPKEKIGVSVGQPSGFIS